MATETADVARLLEDVGSKGENFLKDGEDESHKKELLEAARKLVRSLESPFEVLARMCWQEPFTWAAARVGLDIGLFEAMAAEKGSPKDVDELAAITKCDPALLSRFLKHLAASHFVLETGPNAYAPNGITLALATRIPAGLTINCYIFNTINGRLPEFLRNHDYANPTDKDDTPFKYAVGTPLHYFDWISQPGMEAERDALNAHMEFKTLGKKWFETVPVSDILAGATDDPDATLLVDIGGSAGHDVIAFHAAFPDLPGRLVLQDLPSIISSLPPDFPADIQAMGHDAFTPQPVQHAKAYYLHHVLHDWPDAQCREILSNIVPAMKKGYSRILLNEIVVPDVGADWFATSVDMIMLATHAAQERTESKWRELVEGVGLRVVRVWDCEGSSEKLIEVDLV